MKKILFGFFVFVFFLQGYAFSQTTFLELYNRGGFFDTNLEKQSFASLLGRFEGKAGWAFLEHKLHLYGVYYGAASQADDYWNNYLTTGVGMRVIPFNSYRGRGWADEWIKGVKFFVESIGTTYLKNSVSAEALAKTDCRYGLEIWHEWNQEAPIPSLPWGELWAQYAYRETNFGWEEFKDKIFYFQPKMGIHLGDMIKPYLCINVTASAKEGPAYSFLNIADYGLGIRFQPFQDIGSRQDLFRKFKMFVEVVKVSYLKDKPAEANKQVSQDVRFGVEFSYGR